MKKLNNSKKVATKKGTEKAKDSDELRKPTKLKPLKEKEKKGWKHNLDDDEDDFRMEDDVKLDSHFDEDEDEDFYSEDF